MLLAVSLHAQKVTSFLGIPVDGPKVKMVSLLKGKGFTRAGKDCMRGCIKKTPCMVNILTNKGRVYAVSVVEEDSLMDASAAIGKYNALIKYYKGSKNYTEYETNSYIRETDNLFFEERLAEDMYYAEFFQVCDPQLYDRLVSFRIMAGEGGYYIQRCYVNVHNAPEKKEE